MLVLGLFALLAASCASVPHLAPSPPSSDRACLFVIDGAGDYRACSKSIRNAAVQEGLPVDVITYVWSHGYLRNIIDQTDYEHARERGVQLAELVHAHKSRHPNAPITIIGHSAGSAVALAAVEQLPAGCIDHVILFAPSLSENYEIQPSLAKVNIGIDVFASQDDWIWLGMLVRVLGTMDNPFSSRPAGQYGFAVPEDCPNAGKLRMHQWKPGDKKIGHDGGHFGCYQPGFLHAQVFPIIVPGCHSEHSEESP